MASPYFFETNFPGTSEFELSESSSRHISQVLRMKKGAEIILTNGKGYTLHAIISNPDKKHTRVKIISKQFSEIALPETCIAISLIKNNNRFEWLAEKATELGISRIVPLVCHRTEKSHFKKERIQSILISAMLQSQQSWLPELSEVTTFNEIITDANFEQKFIAHCLPGQKNDLRNEVLSNRSKMVLIGPEGDFTAEEIAAALENNFLPVSLGETRLRTETAGIVSAVMIK
ncbi:MAG TPA: RsmE family RNA methyltransferase [Hanamia sp.]|nr:RsmE family RNA methyltransferase [Hanamia sp.]